jgi:hypothetical protein
MEILYLLISGIFFLWAIQSTLQWLILWEKHHFTLQGVVRELIITPQGRRFLFSPVLLLKLIAFVMFFRGVFNEAFLPEYRIFVVAVYIVQGIVMLWDLKQHYRKIRLQHFFLFFILIAVLTLLVILYTVPLLDKFIWLVLMDMFIPIFVAFGVFFISFPFELYEDMANEKAEGLLKKRKPFSVLVIGKKTSILMMCLAAVLEKKYNLLRIHALSYHEIGTEIIKKYKRSTEAVITTIEEIDDIERLARMLRPNLVVIADAFPEQKRKHIDELLNNLPKNTKTLAVDEYVKSAKVRKSVLPDVYKAELKKTTVKALATDSLITAFALRSQDDTVVFRVLLGSHEFTVQVSTHLKDNVIDCLPAIVAGRYSKIGRTEILEALAELHDDRNTK